ncbi:hypothetical protein ACIRPT_13050 [Streptomyces sp. NPDC101227]|uniref:hypothetical protein n=1 Tax=Streptomyces sp. NPDC101227 TaxID=3366136 RepID=UPI00382CA02D
MDSGLIGLLGGVIGAAVGALGATMSAWITGRKAEAQARMQALAQLEQARLQLKASHVQQQSDPRRGAYAEFLAQARTLASAWISVPDVVDEIVTSQPADWQEHADSYVADLQERTEGLHASWAAVAIHGPETVLEPATKLLEAMFLLRNIAYECMEAVVEAHEHGTPAQTDTPALREAFDRHTVVALEFVLAAREALDEDGISSVL